MFFVLNLVTVLSGDYNKKWACWEIPRNIGVRIRKKRGIVVASRAGDWVSTVQVRSVEHQLQRFPSPKLVLPVPLRISEH